MKFLLAAFLFLSPPAFADDMTILGVGQQHASTSGCTAATNYLARTSGGNEGGNATNITTLICGLVTDGVITGNLSGAAGCGSYLNGLYILAQQNASDAVLNLCGTSFPISPSTATFVAYQGYSLFPSGGMSTNFTPASSSGSVFTQNNASMGIWAYNTPTEGIAVNLGLDNGALGDSIIAANYGGVAYYCYIALGSFSLGHATAPNAPGFYSCDKSSSVGSDIYYNGSFIVNDANGTATLLNDTATIGQSGSYAATSSTIAEANLGASLGSALTLDLYNRLRTYMTAVGAP